MPQEKSGNYSWDRVARWAGIGNNDAGKDTEARSTGTMQDTTTEPDLRDAEGTEIDGTLTEPATDASTGIADQEVDNELIQTRAERDQLRDRLARLQAEFDNARKREAKERTDAREYTIGSTIEPFLGVMDNFGLALKAAGDVAQLRGGVELILKQMEEALRSLNIQPVETVGTQFDPRIHEALGNIETLDHPDGQVLEEIRRGYKVRERLLRPALVRVARNTAQITD